MASCIALGQSEGRCVVHGLQVVLFFLVLFVCVCMYKIRQDGTANRAAFGVHLLLSSLWSRWCMCTSVGRNGVCD